MFYLPEGPIRIFVCLYKKRIRNYEYSFLNVVYQELFFILFNLFGEKYVENNFFSLKWTYFNGLVLYT